MASYGTYKYLVVTPEMVEQATSTGMLGIMPLNIISKEEAILNMSNGLLFEVSTIRTAVSPTATGSKKVYKGTNEEISGTIYRVVTNCEVPSVSTTCYKEYATKGKVKISKIDSSGLTTQPVKEQQIKPIQESFYEKNKTIILVGGGLVLGLILYKNFLK